MLKIQSLSFAFALALGLTACSHPASQIAVAGNAQLQAQVSPGISGEINIIRLRSMAGAPASIAIDMPDMPMHPEPYNVQKNGEAYEASGVQFSMAGTWRVKIYDGSHAALGTFTVTVR